MSGATLRMRSLGASSKLRLPLGSGIVSMTLAHTTRKDLRRGERIDRDVEEPLDGFRVQVDTDDPVRSRELDDVRHELRADGIASLGLLLLALVSVVGDHGGDPGCGGAP